MQPLGKASTTTRLKSKNSNNRSIPVLSRQNLSGTMACLLDLPFVWNEVVRR